MGTHSTSSKIKLLRIAAVLVTLTNTYMSVKEVELDQLMSGYYVGSQTDFKYLDQGMVATAVLRG